MTGPLFKAEDFESIDEGVLSKRWEKAASIANERLASLMKCDGALDTHVLYERINEDGDLVGYGCELCGLKLLLIAERGEL